MPRFVAEHNKTVRRLDAEYALDQQTMIVEVGQVTWPHPA
jgi:hypothetical protein